MHITDRLHQAIQFFSNLGIAGDSTKEYSDVKLLKLYYLFFIEYLNVTNEFTRKPADFEDCRFFAYERGPVEESIYFNLELVKSVLAKTPQAAAQHEWNTGEDGWFSHCNPAQLNEALGRVGEKYKNMTEDEIVRFTHNTLTEWKYTPLFSEMTFPFGYKQECMAADAYRRN